MKKIISISIEPELIKRIDNLRDLASRSRYIENLLQKQLSAEENKK